MLSSNDAPLKASFLIGLVKVEEKAPYRIAPVKQKLASWFPSLKPSPKTTFQYFFKCVAQLGIWNWYLVFGSQPKLYFNIFINMLIISPIGHWDVIWINFKIDFKWWLNLEQDILDTGILVLRTKCQLWTYHFKGNLYDYFYLDSLHLLLFVINKTVLMNVSDIQ